jgi:hypothetical protein
MGRGWWRGAYSHFSPYGYGHYAPIPAHPGYAPYYPPGHGYSGSQPPTKEEQLKMLKEEADVLRNEIEAIEAEMKKLEKAK